MLSTFVYMHILTLPPQVGLAVDDIKGILEAAVLKRLALQVLYMYMYIQSKLGKRWIAILGWLALISAVYA